MINKIRRLLLASLALTFFLTGCFNKPVVLEKTQEQTNAHLGQVLYERKSGILKELATPATEKKIKYNLETEDNQKILLTSNFVDLSATQYLNKKVEVVGPLTIDNNNVSLMEVEIITVLDDALFNMEEEANTWKIEENKNLGIKIQYKGFLFPEESDTEIRFVSVKEKNEVQDGNYKEKITIKRFDNEDNKNLNTWIKENERVEIKDQAEGIIGAANLKAYKVTGSDDKEVSFYCSKEKNIYKISHLSVSSEEKDLFRNNFYEMLRTLELIPIENNKIKTETEKRDNEGTKEQADNKEQNEKTLEQDKTEESLQATENKPEGEKTEEKNTETPISSNNTTEKIETDDVNDDYQKVIAEVQSNIVTIAPEASSSGSWDATKFEFAAPNYVYVEYQSTTEKRKMLLTYAVKSIRVDTALIGYFKPGEDKDWETVSGKNEAAGKSRVVITLDQTGDAKKEADIKEGYRLFESTTYHFKMQYPANWYYGGLGSGHYIFSDKPSGTGTTLIDVMIYNDKLDNYSAKGYPELIAGKNIVKETTDSGINIYIEPIDGKVFKLSGAVSLQDIISIMAGSIME